MISQDFPITTVILIGSLTLFCGIFTIFSTIATFKRLRSNKTQQTQILLRRVFIVYTNHLLLALFLVALPLLSLAIIIYFLKTYLLVASTIIFMLLEMFTVLCSATTIFLTPAYWKAIRKDFEKMKQFFIRRISSNVQNPMNLTIVATPLFATTTHNNVLTGLSHRPHTSRINSQSINFG